jgi:hypothetical protein
MRKVRFSLAIVASFSVEVYAARSTAVYRQGGCDYFAFAKNRGEQVAYV